jgi:hypothetical protein
LNAIIVRWLLITAFLSNTLATHAQTFNGYFRLSGMPDLCELAHPANKYKSGEYTVAKKHIDVTLKSRDNVIGHTVTTRLRIIIGSGIVYFSDILILSDDYVSKPFEELTAEADILLSMAEEPGEGFQPIRGAFIKRYGNDMHHWSGKTWALLMLNLYYYTYCQ